MKLAHRVPANYELSATAQRLAEGIRNHHISQWSNENLYGKIRQTVFSDRAQLALSALYAMDSIGHDVVTMVGDEVVLNHEPYIRSCKFLWECGFSNEVIATLDLSVEAPYGMI